MHRDLVGETGQVVLIAVVEVALGENRLAPGAEGLERIADRFELGGSDVAKRRRVENKRFHEVVLEGLVDGRENVLERCLTE